MHRPSILRLTAASLALVGCLAVSAVVFAAPGDKEIGTFEPLAASGISGEVDLNAMPIGGSLVHGTLRGLEPNTTYEVILFENSSCSTVSETGIEIITFTSTPSGVGSFNIKVEEELDAIGSVSVRLADTLPLLACAAVTPAQ